VAYVVQDHLLVYGLLNDRLLATEVIEMRDHV
jgi:hypothetical protein